MNPLHDDNSARFLQYAEEFIARHEPESSVEEIMAQFAWVVRVHKEFNQHCKKTNTTFDMPRKAENTLERRKVFINWYIERNKGRYMNEIVEELQMLVFASETTITNVIYNYQ